MSQKSAVNRSQWARELLRTTNLSKSEISRRTMIAPQTVKAIEDNELGKSEIEALGVAFHNARVYQPA
jgi:hypothetical protein